TIVLRCRPRLQTGHAEPSNGWSRLAQERSSPCRPRRMASIQANDSARSASMETPEIPRERRSVPRTITPLSVPAVNGAGLLNFPLQHAALEVTVRSALQEDGAFNDVTTIATVLSDRRSRATLVAREN